LSETRTAARTGSRVDRDFEESIAQAAFQPKRKMKGRSGNVIGKINSCYEAVKSEDLAAGRIDT
jgi:ribosomal protein L21E